MNRNAYQSLLVALLFASASHADTTGSVTPAVDFVTVTGDERRFREDWWMPDRWSGGIEQFALEHDIDEHTVLRAEGRAVFDAEDYRLRLEIVRYSVGFFRAGYTEHRTFYDDWGGFYGPFTPPALRLDRELHLDNGDVFVDVGLTLPDLPRLTLGYERQFRDGTKSLLQWGGVQQNDVQRNIFPSFKHVDEKVDIFKFELDHHVGIVNLGDQFRFERSRTDNNTFDKNVTNLTTGADQNIKIHEQSSYDLFSNAFRMDSRVNEKLYWSTGYLFRRLDGDAGLDVDTVRFAIVSPASGPVRDWFTHSVALDQNSHLLTANTLLGPFKQLSVYGGARAEKTRDTGNTDAELLQVLETFTNAPLALIRSTTDKQSLEETLGARFTGLPYTTLYAEGKWREEQYSTFQFETDDTVTNVFRDTDADVFRQQYTIGLNSSPVRRISLSGYYRRSMQQNNYEHNRDISPGYPGFITDQEFTTDQVVAKLTVRPHTKFTLALQYKLTSTAIRTANKNIVFSGSTLVPAGSLQSGDYDANTYTLSTTLTPISRLYLTGAITFQDTRTIGFANHVPSVTVYRGNVYSVFGTAGYALDAKTDVTLDYTFSRSDNFKDNSASGLPLGLDNQRHALVAGLTRRVRENIVIRVRYGFYEYDQSSNGGIANYVAHLASAACTVGF
jgi:hypothetical protein